MNIGLAELQTRHVPTLICQSSPMAGQRQRGAAVYVRCPYFRSASSGHWSARYLSVASRTIQASETFFAAASFSSSPYTSGGKLIDARVCFVERLAFFVDDVI